MIRPALGLIETGGLSGAIIATRAATKAAGVVIASAERLDANRVVVKIEGDWKTVQVAVEAGARAADEAGDLISMHVIPQTGDDVSSLLPYRRFVNRYMPGEAGDTKPPAKRKPRAKKTKPAASHPAPAPAPEPKRVVEPEPTPEPVVTPLPTVVEEPERPTVVSEERAVLPAPTPTVPEPVVPKPQPTAPVTRTVTSAPEPAPRSSSGTMSLADMEKLSVVKLRRVARTIANLPIQGRQISMANKTQLLDAIKTVLGD
ncbi:MAG: BMC domain-containing protein [candidate division Zixibacteria bacterium]|nr:BMC domain-containing protein [candidate division Zixibacteria bacterium]